MVKFPETQARIIHNIFVCKKCKSKRRSTMLKILQGKVSCRRCQGKAFRPIKKRVTK